MPLDTAKVLADRVVLIAELPTTVTINGKAYSGRKSQRKTSARYSDFGQIPNYVFSVSLSTADTLAVGDLATISAVDYRILDLDIGAIDNMKILHLGSEHE